MELNYSSYLKLSDILSSQESQSHPAEHDEMLFIVIHQTYELWFKQILHEGDLACEFLKEKNLWGSMHTLKRIRMIIKTLVSQVDILETMTPISFSSFRNRLETASGFQSMQFREIECLFGIARPDASPHLHDELYGYKKYMQRTKKENLRDCLFLFLKKSDAKIPENIPPDFPYEGNSDLTSEIFRIYKEHPDIAGLFELLLDIDEGLQEWRYRHIKLIQRTIGMKTGTGGSPGIPFLMKTLFMRAFPDLWNARQKM
tara:strand:- start:1249 stop:2022 length:774 start_codon:yes stop_codon:yes gene_type:complete